MWALHHELVLYQQSRNCFHHVPDNEIEGGILVWTTSIVTTKANFHITYTILKRPLGPLIKEPSSVSSILRFFYSAVKKRISKMYLVQLLFSENQQPFGIIESVWRSTFTLYMCCGLIPPHGRNILNLSIQSKPMWHASFGWTMMKYAFTSTLTKLGVKGKAIPSQFLVQTDRKTDQIGQTGKTMGIDTTHPIILGFIRIRI